MRLIDVKPAAPPVSWLQAGRSASGWLRRALFYRLQRRLVSQLAAVWPVATPASILTEGVYSWSGYPLRTHKSRATEPALRRFFKASRSASCLTFAERESVSQPTSKTAPTSLEVGAVLEGI